MTSTNSVLPSYKEPPVVEVVMGVQFEPLEKLLAPHTGMYWKEIRAEYPVMRETAHLAPQFEDFESGAPERPSSVIEVFNTAEFPRLFFIDQSDAWLIQLQRDRFIHNWRGGVVGHEYPRYESVSERFFDEFRRFRDFVEREKLGEVALRQLEISYVNHIKPWPEGSDLGAVFVDYRWTTKAQLPSPERTVLGMTFRDPDSPVRLRVSMRPARDSEKNPMLLFELTIRGRLGEDTLEEWFEKGHQRIVRAFTDLTRPEWHSKWGRVK